MCVCVCMCVCVGGVGHAHVQEGSFQSRLERCTHTNTSNDCIHLSSIGTAYTAQLLRQHLLCFIPFLYLGTAYAAQLLRQHSLLYCFSLPGHRLHCSAFAPASFVLFLFFTWAPLTLLSFCASLLCCISFLYLGTAYTTAELSCQPPFKQVKVHGVARTGSCRQSSTNSFSTATPPVSCRSWTAEPVE